MRKGAEDVDRADISIIVPVYNVKDYLARCLDSLLAQTHRAIRILVVDDGSTDGSGRMADDYARRDARITVIHQQNGGLSEARNAGIRASDSEYLMFVDSDDYIEPDSCERLLACARRDECDVVNADNIYVTERECEYMHKRLEGLTLPCAGSAFLTHCLARGEMSMCVQYGLYSRALIVDNGLYFKPGIYHEDELWTPQVYLAAQRVSHADMCFYYHCCREGSITQSRANLAKRAADMLQTCGTLDEIVTPMEFEGKAYLQDYIVMLYLNAVRIGGFTGRECRAFVRRVPALGKNRLKAALYARFPRLYLALNAAQKRVSAALHR